MTAIGNAQERLNLITASRNTTKLKQVIYPCFLVPTMVEIMDSVMDDVMVGFIVGFMDGIVVGFMVGVMVGRTIHEVIHVTENHMKRSRRRAKLWLVFVSIPI